MDTWIFAIGENDIKDGEMKQVTVDGERLLLLRKSGTFYALSDKCPHMGCSLAKGTFKDFIIQCPCHNWRFDVRSGEFADAKQIKVPSYATKVTDAKVFIEKKG